MRALFVLLSSALFVFSACAHNADTGHTHDTLVAEWLGIPNYTLPREAERELPRPEQAEPQRELLKRAADPVVFLGAAETHRIETIATVTPLLSEAFSVELWVLDHVNNPVGAMLGAFPQSSVGGEPSWALGFLDQSLAFGFFDAESGTISMDIRQADLEPYNKWLHHYVGTYDGSMLRLYHNGALVSAKSISIDRADTAPASLDLVTFLEAEPYMAPDNLIKAAGLHRGALSTEEVESLFRNRAQLMDEGILFGDFFQFTAGPYLNVGATGEHMNILVETDRPSEMTLHYGKTEQMEHSISGDQTSRKHDFDLAGLSPGEAYFYTIEATDEIGRIISSGLMTFKTGVAEGNPFSFAVIGDTEARPFINDVVAKAVWSERPDFALQLGDMTDSGFQPRRFEWTHEFFTGMNQLIGRIPLAPVPGNGEGDLYWYNHYNNLPDAERYYTFKAGDVQFFMLDSRYNTSTEEGRRDRDGQLEWLRKELAASTAKWKVAAHHHPVYSADEDDYGHSWTSAERNIGDERMRNDFMSLYDAFNVDLVFYGHMHEYERSRPIQNEEINLLDGVIYITLGGGGGNLEDFTPTRQWYTNSVYRGYHYGKVDVEGNVMRFVLRDTEGRVRDRFTLVKTDQGRAQLIEHAVAAK